MSPFISSSLPERLKLEQFICHSYLALLQKGFAMPCLLPNKRCALTAPFHPYLIGGLFSVALS
tara:strand:- start:4727 stop:4915 length:189 start_codon:yes stop_codon:yes gene_type:complete